MRESHSIMTHDFNMLLLWSLWSLTSGILLLVGILLFRAHQMKRFRNSNYIKEVTKEEKLRHQFQGITRKPATIEEAARLRPGHMK